MVRGWTPYQREILNVAQIKTHISNAEKNITIKSVFSNVLNMNKFVGIRCGNQNSYNLAQSIDGPIILDNVVSG